MPYTCDATTAGLAYLALGYVLASITYLIIAKLTLTTPFKDSLSEAQRESLARSRQQRKCAFFTGVVVAVLVLTVCRPFSEKKCRAC